MHQHQHQHQHQQDPGGHQREDCLARGEPGRRLRRDEGPEEGDGGHRPAHHRQALPDVEARCGRPDTYKCINFC